MREHGKPRLDALEDRSRFRTVGVMVPNRLYLSAGLRRSWKAIVGSAGQVLRQLRQIVALAAAHIEDVARPALVAAGARRTITAEAEFRGVPIAGAKAVKSVVEKFQEKYGAKDVKKYYSKFDVAVVVSIRA